jgi:alkylhydroperoxidase family enzyme
VGRDKGLTEEKLAALGAGPDSEVYSEEERAVLRYADAMTETPVKVSAELFEHLSRLYDERQIVELTSALAWENYRARFAHALDFEAEGLSEGAYCPLPAAT